MIDQNIINQYLYEISLAELELEQESIKIGATQSLCESVNEQVLNEANIESIQKYLDKVVASTQKVWSRWKEKCGTGEELHFLKEIAPKINSFDSSFTINNCPNYTMINFQTLKLVPFDYSKMREDLKGKQVDFIRKYYPKLSSEDGNVYKKLKSITITGYNKEVCDKRFLTITYNFCSTRFYKARDTIEADLLQMNNSITSIEQLVNTMNSDQQVQARKESMTLYESMLLEAIPSQQNQNTNPKMSFSDKDGETTNADNKIKRTGNVLAKDISKYIGSSARILSAKMKLLNEIYRGRMSIINHFNEITEKKPQLLKANSNGKISSNKIQV